MPVQDPRGAFRPFAALLAMVFVAGIWIPTVSTAAPHPVAGSQVVVVAAAAGGYTPVLM